MDPAPEPSPEPQTGKIFEQESLPALEPIPETEHEAVSPLVDLTRATEVTPEVNATIEDMLEYHRWNSAQQVDGALVREAVQELFAVMIQNVPPGPDRSSGMRKLREVRMDCNSAITHGGKY